MKVYRFPMVLYDAGKKKVTVTDNYFYVPATGILRIEVDESPVVKIHTTSGNFFSHLSGDELVKLMGIDVVALISKRMEGS